MTTQDIANRLYELAKQGDFDKAQNELFSDDATSTESNMSGELETANELQAIKGKGKNFREMVEEMHGADTKEPKVFGKYIFMEMSLDATMKNMGRMAMNEMGVYETRNGKIISERFYY